LSRQSWVNRLAALKQDRKLSNLLDCLQNSQIFIIWDKSAQTTEGRKRYQKTQFLSVLADAQTQQVLITNGFVIILLYPKLFKTDCKTSLL